MRPDRSSSIRMSTGMQRRSIIIPILMDNRTIPMTMSITTTRISRDRRMDK
jgi:hypothetical protein